MVHGISEPHAHDKPEEEDFGSEKPKAAVTNPFFGGFQRKRPTRREALWASFLIIPKNSAIQ
jgi:hypothetical protein